MLIIAGLLKVHWFSLAADGWNVENDPGSDKGLNLAIYFKKISITLRLH
jgi:hypothetical protein